MRSCRVWSQTLSQAQLILNLTAQHQFRRKPKQQVKAFIEI